MSKTVIKSQGMKERLEKRRKEMERDLESKGVCKDDVTMINNMAANMALAMIKGNFEPPTMEVPKELLECDKGPNPEMVKLLQQHEENKKKEQVKFKVVEGRKSQVSIYSDDYDELPDDIDESELYDEITDEKPVREIDKDIYQTDVIKIDLQEDVTLQYLKNPINPRNPIFPTLEDLVYVPTIEEIEEYETLEEKLEFIGFALNFFQDAKEKCMNIKSGLERLQIIEKFFSKNFGISRKEFFNKAGIPVGNYPNLYPLTDRRIVERMCDEYSHLNIRESSKYYDEDVVRKSHIVKNTFDMVDMYRSLMTELRFADMRLYRDYTLPFKCLAYDMGYSVISTDGKIKAITNKEIDHHLEIIELPKISRDTELEEKAKLVNDCICADKISLVNDGELYKKKKYIPRYSESMYDDKYEAMTKFAIRVAEKCNDKKLPILNKINYIKLGERNFTEFMRTKAYESYNHKISMKTIHEFKEAMDECIDSMLEELSESYGLNIISADDLYEHYENRQLKYIGMYFNDVILRNKATSIKDLELLTNGKFGSSLIYALCLKDKNGDIHYSYIPLDSVKSSVHSIYNITRMYEYNRITESGMEFTDIPQYMNRDKKMFISTQEICKFACSFGTIDDYEIVTSFPMTIYRNLNSVSVSENLPDVEYIKNLKKQLSHNKQSTSIIIMSLPENYNTTSIVVKDYICKACASSEYENILIEVSENSQYVNLQYICGISRFANKVLDPKYVIKSEETIKPLDTFGLGRNDKFLDFIDKHKDISVQYPYESYDKSYMRMIRECAYDNDVISIKQTIYRIGDDEELVDLLVDARLRGKNVTLLVEAKAKGDEYINLDIIRRLKKAGVEIIYGPKHKKTHAKLCHIMRRNPKTDKVKEYAYIGTGNFNSNTAALYEDIGIFTNNPVIASDVYKLFDCLSQGRIPDFNPQSIVVSCNYTRKTILSMIDNTMRHPEKSSIRLKMNGLTDKEIIDKLYDASQSGVQIDIICRGMCLLRPGVEGVSDNITVKSLVGGYLEHSRVFEFNYITKSGEKKTKRYVGSCDMMERNLDDRVEVLLDVSYCENEDVSILLDKILTFGIKDNDNAYILDSDFDYLPDDERTENNQFNAQYELISFYEGLLGINIFDGIAV